MDETRDKANAVSCLMMDSCLLWRLANGLTSADYNTTPVFSCPRVRDYGRHIEPGEAAGVAGNLRFCYMRGEKGYQLIYNEETRSLNKLWRVTDADEDYS